MSKKQIRPMRAEELFDALRLCMQVFLRFNAGLCTQEGIKEFASCLDHDFILSRLGDGELRFWVAADDEEIVGVCAMRGLAHIELLFVSEAYQGQGVGKNLLKHALIDSRNIDESIYKVTANVYPAARPFFARMGFAETGDMQILDGIPFIPMAVTGTIQYK